MTKRPHSWLSGVWQCQGHQPTNLVEWQPVCSCIQNPQTSPLRCSVARAPPPLTRSLSRRQRTRKLRFLCSRHIHTLSAAASARLILDVLFSTPCIHHRWCDRKPLFRQFSFQQELAWMPESGLTSRLLRKRKYYHC